MQIPKNMNFEELWEWSDIIAKERAQERIKQEMVMTKEK